MKLPTPSAALRLALLCSTALVAPLAAQAQETGSSAVSEVVVTASRIETPRSAIAATVELIDAEAIVQQALTVPNQPVAVA